MMKKLVWTGKAFPGLVLAAAALLSCLFADGAAAAQPRKAPSPIDCASASQKNKPPCAPERQTGEITVFWPKLHLSNALSRTINSKMEVWIDKANVGLVHGNTPLTLTLPNGPHVLALKPFDDYLENIRPIKETQITVSSQKPLYFQIIDQGYSISASELDAATAQSVLAGKEAPAQTAPSAAEPSSSVSQAPVSGVSQTSVSSEAPKGKPSANQFQTAVAGNNPPTASQQATIYLYWPKPALGLAFLDELATDVPVYLDEKRIGSIKLGEFLEVKVPSGEHALALDVGLSYGRLLKKDFVLGASEKRHFHIENHASFSLFEDSPEDAVDFAKGLKQRAAIAAQ